jgi:hypothetical protein
MIKLSTIRYPEYNERFSIKFEGRQGYMAGGRIIRRKIIKDFASGKRKRRKHV